MKLDTPVTKINLKWNKDLNSRLEPLKILEENIRRKLPDLDLAMSFFDITPKPQTTKLKINKWDYIN